MYTLLFNF